MEEREWIISPKKLRENQKKEIIKSGELIKELRYKKYESRIEKASWFVMGISFMVIVLEIMA